KTVSSGMGANLPDKTVSSGMGANLPDKTVSGVRAQHVAPLHQPHHTDLYQPKGGVTPNNVISGSLGAIIRSFKGTVTRLAHQKDDYQTPIWHRNYHEHVIRDEKSLNFIREYILYNPAKWEQDSLYQK
ncbi:MAG: transposase, partial [bacterium]|nr:transposase [bacterium]